MTIFNPSKQKNNIRFFIYLILLVLVGGSFLVIQYNSVASLRAEERFLETQINRDKVKNAELKSELYTITNTDHLEETAVAFALIIEPKPRYLFSKSQ